MENKVICQFLIGQMTVQIMVNIWIYALIVTVDSTNVDSKLEQLTFNATRFEKRIGQLIV